MLKDKLVLFLPSLYLTTACCRNMSKTTVVIRAFPLTWNFLTLVLRLARLLLIPRPFLGDFTRVQAHSGGFDYDFSERLDSSVG